MLTLALAILALALTLYVPLAILRLAYLSLGSAQPSRRPQARPLRAPRWGSSFASRVSNLEGEAREYVRRLLGGVKELVARSTGVDVSWMSRKLSRPRLALLTATLWARSSRRLGLRRGLRLALALYRAYRCSASVLASYRRLTEDSRTGRRLRRDLDRLVSLWDDLSSALGGAR